MTLGIMTHGITTLDISTQKGDTQHKVRRQERERNIGILKERERERERNKEREIERERTRM
jgi:hypothetical protein